MDRCSYLIRCLIDVTHNRAGYDLSGLVIWPQENDHLIRYNGTEGWAKACEELKAHVGEVTEPSVHYHELLDVVSRRFAAWDDRPGVFPPSVYDTAYDVLLADAVARNDFPRWTKTVRRYRVHRVDRRMWPAIQKWGFSAIRPEYVHIHRRSKFRIGANTLGPEWRIS